MRDSAQMQVSYESEAEGRGTVDSAMEGFLQMHAKVRTIDRTHPAWCTVYDDVCACAVLSVLERSQAQWTVLGFSG